MKFHISGSLGAFALAGVLGIAPTLAQNAYVSNAAEGTVSVIDTQTNTMTAVIPVSNLG